MANKHTMPSANKHVKDKREAKETRCGAESETGAGRGGVKSCRVLLRTRR